MNKYVWMSFVAILAGAAIVVAWGYINLTEFVWESVLVFFFGHQQGWLLMLAGIPLFGVLNSAVDSLVNAGHEKEEREIADYANLMLHAAILKNQEERLAPLFKEKEAIKAREIALQAREAEAANKELAIKKTANLEMKFEESKLNNKLLKQENNALKNENAHLKKELKKYTGDLL
jgi:hypothetical protein